MGIVKEFKDFISKGNVLDMAVGIIIGSAFTAIVTSLVDDIIMPIVGLVNPEGGFTAIQVGPFMLGNFISAVLNFLIVAVVLFTIIKAANKATSLITKPEEPAAPTEKECPYCKSMIPIAATRCAHCTSQLEEK